ncbi:telomere length and silencing protein 1 homolog [Lacerta agilis]|uniref:telomere length and silencing protein 1 homolog n=1 Tax=Lacerta agilis TaxID=80427 RepID=UPI00141A16AB|nr:telomere length and silencing protein 1 homolog [Lacerta agilis]
MTPSRLRVSEPTQLVAEPYFSTADRTASSGQQGSLIVQDSSRNRKPWDEDADMMNYIETELKKRKGIVENEEQKVKQKNPEGCLYELPESIWVSSAKKTEEMLSNQMLSGIPEVDLGIEAKIKNIISTKEANTRLLAEEQSKKKDSKTSFVPMNMAVNYVQHNRFYHEELNAPEKQRRAQARPLRVGDTEKPEPERSPPNRKRPPNEKATDGYHYEKFKKMNRWY